MLRSLIISEAFTPASALDVYNTVDAPSTQQDPQAEYLQRLHLYFSAHRVLHALIYANYN